MKHLFYLPLAIMLFAACSSDDDVLSSKVVYAFDANGYPVLANPDLQNLSLQNFQEKICGGAWIPTEEHLINEDGTIDKEILDLSLWDGMGRIWYYMEMDSLIQYSDRDMPPFHTYRNMNIKYDEKTGTVMDGNGNKIFIISAIDDNTFTAYRCGYSSIRLDDNKNHYYQCIYKRISDEEYQKQREWYVDPQEWLKREIEKGSEACFAVKYSFDENGGLVVPKDKEQHTMDAFKQIICGKGWSPAGSHLIKADGTVNHQSYTPSSGKVDVGYTDIGFYFDETFNYKYYTEGRYRKSYASYDETTGTITSNTGRKIMTITSIISENTFVAIDWELDERIYRSYGDHVQTTYQRMSDYSYEQMKENAKYSY